MEAFCTDFSLFFLNSWSFTFCTGTFGFKIIGTKRLVHLIWNTLPKISFVHKLTSNQQSPFCTDIAFGGWWHHLVHLQMIPNHHAEPHFVQEPFLFSILTPSQAHLTRTLTKSVDSVLGAQIALDIFYCPLHMYIYILKIVFYVILFMCFFPTFIFVGGAGQPLKTRAFKGQPLKSKPFRVHYYYYYCYRCHCSYLVLQSAALFSKREHIFVPMAKPDPLPPGCPQTCETCLQTAKLVPTCSHVFSLSSNLQALCFLRSSEIF